MNKLKKNLFLVLLATGFLSLTSCGCFSMKDLPATIEVDPTIEHGSVEVVNLSRDSKDTLTGDTLRIIPKADKGYKLEKLSVNGEDVSDFNRVKLSRKTSYKIEAKFKQFNEVSYEGSFNESKKTTYDKILSSSAEGTIPNEGSSKILVVPVEYSDVSMFTQQELNNLSVCFNGTATDGSNDYWESVSSYYRKSSYGKVNLDFVITDTYDAKMTSNQFINLEKKPGKGTLKLLTEMYDNLTINGQPINYKNYDSNNDGNVDGVWMIHNYRDKNGVFEKNNFWAYCFVDYLTEPNLEKPVFSRYANCSQAFLYNSASNSTQYGRDAHTLIHETGHMFGLDDYYSYDEERVNNKTYQIIGSTGGIDMMDLNIGDHNAFSKFSLGWVNPYKITEDTDIYLKPFQETGECLVIPVKPVMNSAFNEYIIVEYYTPTGLNKLDSESQYNGIYPKLYDRPGLKIFHINAYLQDYTYQVASDVFDELVPYSEFNIRNSVRVGLSNTASRNHYIYEQDGKHNLIEAITPDNYRTYGGNKYLGIRKGKEDVRGLFETGDVFNYKTCTNFFSNKNYLNNTRYNFPWSIRVENLYNDSAAISIRKIA